MIHHSLHSLLMKERQVFFFYFTGRAFFFPLLEQLLSTSDTFLLYYGTGCLSTRWRVRAHRCADHNNTDCKYHSWQSDRHWESKLESWGRKKMSYLYVRLTANRAGHILRTRRSTTRLFAGGDYIWCLYLPFLDTWPLTLTNLPWTRHVATGDH